MRRRFLVVPIWLSHSNLAHNRRGEIAEFAKTGRSGETRFAACANKQYEKALRISGNLVSVRFYRTLILPMRGITTPPFWHIEANLRIS
jgi:hypothetical protein